MNKLLVLLYRSVLFTLKTSQIHPFKQECIPVGCVPSAAVAVSRGEGVSALGGGCLLGGGVCSRGCLLLGGVCSRGWVCSGEVSAPGEGLLPYGCVCSGGVCSWEVSTPRGVSALGECLL